MNQSTKPYHDLQNNHRPRSRLKKIIVSLTNRYLMDEFIIRVSGTHQGRRFCVQLRYCQEPMAHKNTINFFTSDLLVKNWSSSS